jgi:hypothetical protein
MSAADVDDTSRKPDVPPALAMTVSRWVMWDGRREVRTEVEGIGRVNRGSSMRVLELWGLRVDSGLVEVADEVRKVAMTVIFVRWRRWSTRARPMPGGRVSTGFG